MNAQNTKVLNKSFEFWYLNFEFVSDFDIRISDFGYEENRLSNHC